MIGQRRWHGKLPTARGGGLVCAIPIRTLDRTQAGGCGGI
jgi:hypothetical protein